MERMISRRVTGPDGIPAFQAAPFHPGQCQDDSGHLGLFDNSFLNHDAVMFDGGAQLTPALDFSAVQEPIGSPTYPDFSSGFEFDGSEVANWNPGSMFPVYANATQALDLETGPLIPQCGIAQGYLGIPRIVREWTETEPTVLEGDCHLKIPMAQSSEATSQITASGGIRPIHDIDWVQGGTINPQVPCIGSGLKPHARPSELGDEYVSIRLDNVGNANFNLLSDHQAMDVETPAAYNSKPSASIGNDGEHLGPKKSRIERRRSVPRRRLRKRSSLDHGAKLSQSIGTRTQIVGTQVFDANMKIKPSRTRRRFSEDEKERIKHVRKAGACMECRRMKRKCDHALAATPAASPGDDYTGPVTPASDGTFGNQTFSPMKGYEEDVALGQIPFPMDLDMQEPLDLTHYLGPSTCI